MKLVILLAVVALAVAAPPPTSDKDAQIITLETDQQPDGSFINKLETTNGIKAEQQGEVKQVPDEDNKPVEALVIRGSYSYNDPDGNPHQVNYFADETGFHAESPDIPKQS